MTSNSDIEKCSKMASLLLKRLVTTRGIYASTDSGWQGSFHAFFGRDSAITASLIFSAEAIRYRRKRLGRRAYQGLLYLRHWQGAYNNPATGEEVGKISHEVRTGTSRNGQTLGRLRAFRKLWYLDPRDHLLKNWDSADSTPLWVIAVARWHEVSEVAYSPEVLKSLHAGLDWCLRNVAEYGGLAGFTGADLRPERKTTGLHNQSWKDNYGAYQYPDGSLAKHPIKDVFVNGACWAAFKYGAAIFRERDPIFAAVLEQSAKDLKDHFNHPKHGFLMMDSQTMLHYYAEALDGDGKPLRSISADVAMCLRAYCGNECIIDSMYVADVARRVTMEDMLNPEAGIRTYSSSTVVPKLYQGGYHRSSHTYWPFVSGLIVEGLDHFGYKREAEMVANAMLMGVSHFNSCIEMFLEVEPHVFRPWHNVDNKQQSATNQAWTAAAMYYAASYLLLSEQRPGHTTKREAVSARL